MTNYSDLRKELYEKFHDSYHKLYISELNDENNRLRAALRECLSWHDYSNDMHKPIEVRAAYMRARAALEGK